MTMRGRLREREGFRQSVYVFGKEAWVKQTKCDTDCSRRRHVRRSTGQAGVQMRVYQKGKMNSDHRKR